MSSRRLTPIALALALAACGSNPSKPEAAEPKVAQPAGTTATAPAEGQRIEGVNLTPGVAEIAMKEGQVNLVEDERVKCEKYKPLGSNRTKYRCTTIKEEALSKEANNREMRKLQTPPPAAQGTLGK
jgi:ABC-type Fe3+-hydroxamate transport system substrate-binding protein